MSPDLYYCVMYLTDSLLVSLNLFFQARQENESEDQSAARNLFPTPDDTEESNEYSAGEFEEDSDDYVTRAKFTMGSLIYTEEEFLACQLAIKIKTNMSDTTFLKQLNFIVEGLHNSSTNLPNTRYAAEKMLKETNSIKATYVVYCPSCLEICDKDLVTTPKVGKCKNESCKLDFTDEVAKGNCFFLTLPLKDQIESYLKDKKFAAIVRKFGLMKECHMNGELHTGIVKCGHFDLSLGIDAAQLNKTVGKSILPCVLFFNNIPVSWQLRYPLMAALWTGNSSCKPPRKVFLKFVQAELRTLGAPGNEITWKDDLNHRHASLVFLTTVISDGPEKAELMNHIGCSGTFACPYCLVEGRTLSVGQDPEVFDLTNLFRRTVGEESIKGKKFPFLPQEDQFESRTGIGRLEEGRTVARKQVRDKKPNYKKKGIKGLPVLRNLPGFDENDSHVSDTLHVVAHGVMKNILEVLVNGKRGFGHTFLPESTSTYEVYHELQATMTQVSEADRNTLPLGRYSEWKALDSFLFLMHSVALLCSDEKLLKTTEIYRCLVHLSNALYLCHHGRLTEELIDQADKEFRLFAFEFKKIFTAEFCTYKFHLLVYHFIKFLRLHGSAFWTDGFNLERYISQTKKLTTTTRLHMWQIVRNFLLKHHSSLLHNIGSFCEAAKTVLGENGVHTEFFVKFSDVVKVRHPDQQIRTPVLLKKIQDFMKVDLKIQNPENAVMVRITQMTRKSIVLETQDQKHREGTNINDSYIQVAEGKHFGRIQEIIQLPEVAKFIFVLRKFQRIYPQNDEDDVIDYPLNQFPYREPLANNDWHIFELTDQIFVQKAQVAVTSYMHCGEKVKLFTVKPNEWFRF
jgi:hypothetical protein